MDGNGIHQKSRKGKRDEKGREWIQRQERLCHFNKSGIHHYTNVRMETPNELNVDGQVRLSFGGKFDWQIRRSITGSAESSLNNSIGSRLQQLASRADRDAKVKMAHYKGTIVAVKLMSSKGATFARMDELEMTAVSLLAYLLTHSLACLQCCSDYFSQSNALQLQLLGSV